MLHEQVTGRPSLAARYAGAGGLDRADPAECLAELRAYGCGTAEDAAIAAERSPPAAGCPAGLPVGCSAIRTDT